MKNKKEEYYNVNSKYLASALAYIGYTFYKFTDDKNRKIYSFLVIDGFHEDLTQLNKIKHKNKK